MRMNLTTLTYHEVWHEHAAETTHGRSNVCMGVVNGCGWTKEHLRPLSRALKKNLSVFWHCDSNITYLDVEICWFCVNDKTINNELQNQLVIQGMISNFNCINTIIRHFKVPTNNLGWEECNKTAPSSSWHVADEIPEVSYWVVLVNGRWRPFISITSTNCQ